MYSKIVLGGITMGNIKFINDAYTMDGLHLPMIHFDTNEKDICVIFIHGMCQTIIDNYFATVWGNILSENNIGFLYEHNRGYSIENDILMKDGSFKRCGCMYEIFEDCIYDIDLAIENAGRACHFLQDVSQPQHIEETTTLGKAIDLKIHTDFEDFTEKNVNEYAQKYETESTDRRKCWLLSSIN